MANAEHLEMLKSGVGQWNTWRKDQEPDYLDLSGADLRGVDLRKANLYGVVLINANLSNANLSEASLGRACFHHANLCDANLSGADLVLTSLNGTLLHRANLEYTNLMVAELTRAELNHANLSRADLDKANLNEANLSGANLYWARLSEASLIQANLTNANLSYAKLWEANLTRAILNEAIFLETSLGGTVFGLTNLSSCHDLETVEVFRECVIDNQTLRVSKLPKEFLTKLGVPESLVEYLPDFYNSALMIYPAFLSHSSKDKPFVRKLYETLTKQGVTTWLDEKNLKPGDNLHDSISEGIKYYDKLILVCSENSLNSWWVEKELEKVYEKEREMQKERGKKFRLVIPIRIDDHILNWKEGILTTVRNSVIGDFTQWQDDTAFEKAVKELVDALNAKRVDIRPSSLL